MRYKNKITGNIIAASQEFINSLQDANDYELVPEPIIIEPEPTPPTFEEIKQEAIDKLHADYQAEYDKYINQYPEAEVETFATKQREAEAYELDNLAPTPRISAMVANNESMRLEMINSILAKLDYLSFQEGRMIDKRDKIKACTTEAELNILNLNMAWS